MKQLLKVIVTIMWFVLIWLVFIWGINRTLSL
jgi:preprotein translocase subunit SecE